MEASVNGTGAAAGAWEGASLSEKSSNKRI